MAEPSKYTRRRQQQLAEERERLDTWYPAATAVHVGFIHFFAWPFVLLWNLVTSFSRTERS